MIYKDICTKRTWIDKEGKQKTKWFKVGTLRITDEGKQFIELNLLPDTPLYVFDQKEKEESF